MNNETMNNETMNNGAVGSEQCAACPFCGSTETEFFSLFGQFLLASQYYCRNCRTVFDVVRWTEDKRRPPAENMFVHPFDSSTD